jgi:hypothetical protein
MRDLTSAAYWFERSVEGRGTLKVLAREAGGSSVGAVYDRSYFVDIRKDGRSKKV